MAKRSAKRREEGAEVVSLGRRKRRMGRGDQSAQPDVKLTVLLQRWRAAGQGDASLSPDTPFAGRFVAALLTPHAGLLGKLRFPAGGHPHSAHCASPRCAHRTLPNQQKPRSNRNPKRDFAKGEELEGGAHRQGQSPERSREARSGATSDKGGGVGGQSPLTRGATAPQQLRTSQASHHQARCEGAPVRTRSRPFRCARTRSPRGSSK